MIVYAESSAVLAWLLGEPDGDDVRDRLNAAEKVITSRLTLAECERVLIRAVAVSELTQSEADAARMLLAPATARWAVTEIATDVIDALRRAFPKEPVRTLDAIHLATMLVLRPASPEMTVLALDGRVRENATLLGFEVLPP